MRRFSKILLFIFMLYISPNTIAQDNHEVTGKILHRSGSVAINGVSLFYCEVKIINKSKSPVSIVSANVQTHKGKSLYKVSNEELQKLSNKNSNNLPVGDSSIFYFDIPYKGLKNAEILIFEFTCNNKQGKKIDVILKTNFSAKKPIVLSAPLKGKNWIAIYNSEWQRGHRRVYYTIDGKSRIPGRFAIDFVKLDDEGKLYQENPDEIKDYYSYDKDVLAVESGRVVSMRNDFKESKTIASNPTHLASEASGNYVILQIGEDVYACYEHLKPGSIVFKVGDKVQKGYIIAKVGFTGNATEPHLHFHVADKNSVLGAEGLPFLLNDYSYEGIYNDFSNFGKQCWQPFENAGITNNLPSRPLPNSVISFPN